MSPASALKSIRNQIDQLLTELGSEPEEIAFHITISAPKLKAGDPACPVIGWVDPMGKFEERSFSFNPEPGWTTVIRQSDALAAIAPRDATIAELRERLEGFLIQLNTTNGALLDLSFECDGINFTKPPSRETYNRTFYVAQKTKSFIDAAMKEGAA